MVFECFTTNCFTWCFLLLSLTLQMLNHKNPKWVHQTKKTLHITTRWQLMCDVLVFTAVHVERRDGMSLAGWGTFYQTPMVSSTSLSSLHLFSLLITLWGWVIPEGESLVLYIILKFTAHLWAFILPSNISFAACSEAPFSTNFCLTLSFLLALFNLLLSTIGVYENLCEVATHSSSLPSLIGRNCLILSFQCY